MWIATHNGKQRLEERVTDPVTGKQRIVSVVLKKNTATCRKEAEIKLRAKINSSKPSQMKLSDLFAKNIVEQERTLKLSTVSRNRMTYGTLTKILDDPYVNKLTAGYIRERLLSTGRSATTINEWMSRLKTVLRWAYRNDIISDYSVIEKLVPLKEEKSHREKIKDKFLDTDELNKLLPELMIPRWRLLTQFMVLSGLRFGEVAALDVSDVDDSYIHVTKTLSPIQRVITSPKTMDSIRDVYIQPELAECISSIRIAMQEQADNYGYVSDYFFSDPDGERIDYAAYNNYLKENAERVLGRKHITTHVLRHTHTSLLAGQGIPLDVISRRLGHHDSQITKDVYLHVTKSRKNLDDDIMSNVQILT